MSEEKRRVNASIDMKLYENVMKLGYSISEAITLGFERLLEPVIEEGTNDTQPHNEGLLMSLYARIESLEYQLKAKDNQIDKLTENMQAQSIHIQTLINQKAIDAPGNKKPFWKFW